MRKIRNLWRSAFDIREGEHRRTVFMFLYLFCVLFAYYILKPVSTGMFLTKFDPDKLPRLSMMIAVGGGLLAYFYSKLTVRASLRVAVAWATALSVLSLVGFWWFLRPEWKWLLYPFNVWVSLFSIVTVSQGWLVAANVFNSREAKRLYGILGAGAVVGAALGGTFASLAVRFVGSRGLVLVSALWVVLAYVAFRCAISQKGISLAGASAAEPGEDEFAFRDVLGALARHRHLRVIMAVITLTLIVDELVKFQFQSMAARVYTGDQLTAFLAVFYGFYTNAVTIPLQFFLTAAVVRRLGVGGTLQVMPVSLAAVSLGIMAVPGLVSTGVARIAEAAGRYTLNKTATELLYMPLPLDLRNRTKAFVDIFMDRLGRGLAAGLLALLLTVKLGDVAVKELPLPQFVAFLRQISFLVIGFAAGWIVLSVRAQKEYLQTVRSRLDARRLDLDSLRVTVGDPSMLALVEQAARSTNPRQACYALSLLAEAPGYPLDGLLQELAGSSNAEVRGKVYELARPPRFPGLLERALQEVRSSSGAGAAATVKPAVGYVLALSPDAIELAREFLDHPSTLVAESALEAIPDLPEGARDLVTHEWLSRNAADSDPERRRLAAVAIGACGDEGTEALHRLLDDPGPRVAAAACRAAGRLKNRVYLHAIVSRLADSRVRGVAIEALAAYGTRISGTLGDILEDDRVPVAARRQIPRALKAAPDQRNVDVLLRSISQPDLSVRAAVLKALNKLREMAPTLDYGSVSVTRQILSEARLYFELNAALQPFRDQTNPRTAVGLLALSIEERLKQTLERLFRLLGLRYPPKEIYAVYLAVYRGRGERHGAALDFLESVLDRDLKRVVVPLLDDAARLAEQGRDLLGVEVKSAEEAIRDLIRSGDKWLVACAMAAAAELKFHSLAPDIAEAARGAGAEVCQVAVAAQTALA